ncbi:enoyl-CoA hydratase/isomerase family protein [Natronomonas sp.]|uniref:enoyl-CoA hydratase/isomerase family protein n=1 Tax=Natronomonas sp. TaxID=2184060 RepID=UPI0039898EFA
MSSVRLDTDSGVGTLTIDRQEQYNALDSATLEALESALEEARTADIGALVVTGAGEESFSVGADIAELVDASVPEADAYVELAQRVTRTLLEFPVPTIAAINGYCLGGGWELALCCDMRVASERAVLGHTELDLAVVPTWGGIRRLVRLVGDETARRLVFFAERLDAQDAYELDLVGDIIAHGNIDEYAHGLADDLTAQPTFALQGAKEAFEYAWREREADLGFQRRLWGELFGTDTRREEMREFLNR